MGIYLDKLTEKMKKGKIVCGVCVSLNDPAVSELVGLAGYGSRANMVPWAVRKCRI